jgi:ribosomal protein L18E
MSLSRIVANVAPKHNEANAGKTVVVVAKVTDDTRYVYDMTKEVSEKQC